MILLKRRLNVVLRSSKLFRNWFNAALTYYVRRKTLERGAVRVRCLNNIEYELPIESYKFIVNHFYDGFISRLECAEDYLDINGIRIPTDLLSLLPPVVIATYVGSDGRFGNVSISKEQLVFGFKGSKVTFLKPFIDELILDAVIEVFFNEVYGDLDVRGRTVVDIGAGIGDSAIYFGIKNASRVISLEPYPSLFQRALDNISANRLTGRVILLNAGLGPLGGVHVGVPDHEVHEYKPLSGRPFRDQPQSVRVPVYDLSQLVKEFELEGAILKIDCEGCEYDVLVDHKRRS